MLMPRRPVSCSFDDALGAVAERLAAARAGGRRPVFYLPGNAGRLAAAEQWIFDHAARLEGVDVFQVLALGPARGWAQAVMGGVGIVTPFIGPGVRELVNRGLARNIRCHLSQVPRLFEGRWRPDVALAHVSPPDAEGRVTLGLNAGIDHAPVRQAAFKVAFVNARLPRWHVETLEDAATGRSFETGCALPLAHFDLVVEIDEPLTEHPMQPAGAAQRAAIEAIARRIVDVLAQDPAASADGLPNVLQLGIGKIPDAVARELAGRGLSVAGLWSELFSDGVLALYRAGLVRRTTGPGLRDRIVVGFVLGSGGLYETMRGNPHFAVLPQDVVNDPALIARNPHMASVNSAIAVSLAGEVTAATIRRDYYSDVGGQFDFALGASWAHRGTSIIALPSVARLRNGALESKIVALHPEGAHHTIGADLPVVVITEQGTADLRALDDSERVEAMLGVAHPDWRAILAKEARTLPSMQGVGAVEPRLVALHDGRTAVLRPAGRQDIDAIRDYITRLSDDDRQTRYMGTVSVRALTAGDRLTRLYHDTLDYLLHAAFIVDLDGEIVGVAHAFRSGEAGDYEVSFSRRSDLVGQGIGGQLMRMLVDWGVEAGAREFHAITYRTRNPRMRALFDAFGFAVEPHAEDPETVGYRARVAELAQVGELESGD